jgi:hypothetical protein
VTVLEATAAGALVERPRIVFGVAVLDDNRSDDMRRIVVVDDVVDLDNNIIMINYSCCSFSRLFDPKIDNNNHNNNNKRTKTKKTFTRQKDNQEGYLLK